MIKDPGTASISNFHNSFIILFSKVYSTNPENGHLGIGGQIVMDIGTCRLGGWGLDGSILCWVECLVLVGNEQAIQGPNRGKIWADKIKFAVAGVLG
jgi:hypothetical protein